MPRGVELYFSQLPHGETWPWHHSTKTYGVVEVKLYAFLTSILGESKWSPPIPGETRKIIITAVVLCVCETRSLAFKGRTYIGLEGGGSMFLRSGGICLQVHAVLQPRRPIPTS
jgi:hypothetical protein